MSNKVKKGQVTYDAEGSDVESSKYFSRVCQCRSKNVPNGASKVYQLG